LGNKFKNDQIYILKLLRSLIFIRSLLPVKHKLFKQGKDIYSNPY